MKEALVEFGRFLEQQGLSFETTIIGGAALLVMGVIDRATQDVNCLDPDIPEPIREAAARFAKAYQGAGSPLREDWLNNGPRDLRDDLPPGWQARRTLLYEGPGMRLHVLGRPDMLKTKLFAFCDRGQDEADCVALAPSAEELRECLPWVVERDAHSQWPEHVNRSFAALGEKLGYELEA